MSDLISSLQTYLISNKGSLTGALQDLAQQQSAALQSSTNPADRAIGIAMEPDAAKRAGLEAAANPDLKAQVKLVEDLAKTGDGFRTEGQKIIPVDLDGDGKVLGVAVPVAPAGQPAQPIDLVDLQYGVQANAIVGAVGAAAQKAAATAAYTDGLFAGKGQDAIAKAILAKTPDASKVAVAAALQSAAAGASQAAVAGANGLNLGVLLNDSAKKAAFILAGDQPASRANLLLRAGVPATAADRAALLRAASTDADALALAGLLGLANNDAKADLIVALAGLQPTVARLQAVAQALVAVGNRPDFVRDQGLRLNPAGGAANPAAAGYLQVALQANPAAPAPLPVAQPAPVPAVPQPVPAQPNPVPDRLDQAQQLRLAEVQLERDRIQLERDRMALALAQAQLEQQRLALEMEKLRLGQPHLPRPEALAADPSASEPSCTEVSSEPYPTTGLGPSS